MRLNSPQINLIIKACMKASRSLIRDFGEIENLQVSTKGPGDFVTSADKRTEKILIEELQRAHPEYGIITEETGIINKSNTEKFRIPVFAYQVSGEYSLLSNAVKKKLVNKNVIFESLVAFKRAGANAIVSYYADRLDKIL